MRSYAISAHPKVLIVLASPARLDLYNLDPIAPDEFKFVRDLFDESTDVQDTFWKVARVDRQRWTTELANGVHFVRFPARTHWARSTEGGGGILTAAHVLRGRHETEFYAP